MSGTWEDGGRERNPGGCCIHLGRFRAWVEKVRELRGIEYVPVDRYRAGFANRTFDGQFPDQETAKRVALVRAEAELRFALEDIERARGGK